MNSTLKPPKLRAAVELEKLIIYSSIEKEDEALKYIDEINDYVEVYTGWNLVDAADKIEGYDYEYVTDSKGIPYIKIDSVRDMLNRGIHVEDKKFSLSDLDDIKKLLLSYIRESIRDENSDCGLLVADDDIILYGDLAQIIENVFEHAKESK